jgi:hypothetical protein
MCLIYHVFSDRGGEVLFTPVSRTLLQCIAKIKMNMKILRRAPCSPFTFRTAFTSRSSAPGRVLLLSNLYLQVCTNSLAS